MKTDTFNMKLSLSKRPTNWFLFYVKVRFPLGIIFGSINALSMFTSFEVYNIYVYIYVCAYLGFYAFLIFTYSEIKLLSSRSYYVNLAFIWTEVLFHSSINALSSYTLVTDGFLYSFLVSLIAYSLIWGLTNTVYFLRRKDVFNLGQKKVGGESRINLLVLCL